MRVDDGIIRRNHIFPAWHKTALKALCLGALESAAEAVPDVHEKSLGTSAANPALLQ